MPRDLVARDAVGERIDVIVVHEKGRVAKCRAGR